MADYICIDGGTTNTRISIVSDRRVIDTLKFNIGARKGIENKALLRDAVKNGIAEILAKNHMQEQSITRILASGMITSEFGLMELAHITAPAGIRELHDTMCEVVLEDISEIPFVFIRGVKTLCENIENADMMRGEETELMGILKQEKAVYILPGSHSKIIEVDDAGRIVNFKTMLTGEMIAALSQSTILKDAVALKTTDISEEYLLKGFEFCDQNGINEALFKVRVLKNLFGKGDAEIYNFYMGVVLCAEIKCVLAKNAPKIVIGGKKQIKESMAALLKQLSGSEVVTVPDSEVLSSSAMGMIKVFECKCPQ